MNYLESDQKFGQDLSIINKNNSVDYIDENENIQ